MITLAKETDILPISNQCLYPEILETSIIIRVSRHRFQLVDASFDYRLIELERLTFLTLIQSNSKRKLLDMMVASVI